MRNLSATRYPILLLALMCASCGTALPSIKPYKLDVQQGNVVTSKMLLQLRPGMTQSQVRFIMGTPLIQDSFHGKRWDYVYLMRENGKITEQRRVILDFESDLLKTVRGDVIPSAAASQSNEVADNSGTRVINPSAKSENKSLFSTLKFWEKEPAANPAPQAKAEEQTKQAATPVVASEAKPAAIKPLEAAATPAVGNPAVANPESQSVLAVPLLPAEPGPVAVVEAPAAAVVDTPAAVVPSVEAAPVQAEAAPAVPQVAAEPAAVQAATEASPVEASVAEASSTEPLAASAATPVYESPSGMQFERNLTKLPEDIAPPPVPEPAPMVTKPPAASTELPKAKELPVTAKPSFFDRMLEKIGF
ncbi:Outer membrane protein assembly factor BamE [Methylophilaceae bacterium]